ncbi:MAG: twin-arginine translocase TatA/TatE family subunit [Clostridia bacterium]|nr:twin-arginine translocase TatA/TatE family subunit [Bacillota bacterium]MDA8210490.1 twin-arginine translocase TatA/TatE family subunit [Clostridia bacterium]
MGPLGIPELIIILVLALIIFGPGKLPDVGKALGKGINEFKRASKDVQKEINEAINEPEKDNK